jgi:Ca-activated chloride channel family protein
MHDAKSDKESIDLSKRFHVLSRLTSMLVLENDAMFAAYGIDRTTGKPNPPRGGGPGMIDPAKAASLMNQADDVKLSLLGSLGGAPSSSDVLKSGSGSGLAAPQGNGLGGLGGIGIGTSDQGPTRKAQVSFGGTSMSVPIENAERVIRGALGPRARNCYQRGLASDPSMAGRLIIQMIVGQNGEVLSTNVAANTGLSPAVASCIASASRSLSFAPPAGVSRLQTPMTFVSIEVAPPPPRYGYDYPHFAPPPPPEPTASTRASDDTWRTQGDDAIAKLRAASAASPTSRMKREALIRGLLVRGRFDQALPLARSFVEADPDLPAAREVLSYAAAASGDAKGALLAVDAGVETDASSTKGHVRAARAFEASGDEARACAHWRALAELDGGDEWKYQALRCRARSLGDRDAALADARAIDKPGPLVAKLLPILAAGGDVPAYDPQSSSLGQMEVNVVCVPNTGDCPIPIVVAPNGTIFSPMTPADARSSAVGVAVTVVRDGTYHVMIVGGAESAKGDVVVRVCGVTQKLPFARGGALQSIAASDVSVPPPWFGGLGNLRYYAW